MAQKVLILLLTIGILGGLVFYMYQISLGFEDSVFTQLGNKDPISPPVAPPPPTTPPPPPSVVIPVQPPPPPTVTPTPLPPTPPPALPPPAPASEATLSLLPSSASVKVGDEFKIDIFVDTANQNAVAVLASIIFDKNVLVAERVDVTSSVFPIEAERGVYPGSARIVRGARSPGYNGSHGFFASIYFRAQAKGSGSITIELGSPGTGPSRIILDDGQGTDILKNAASARYIVL